MSKLWLVVVWHCRIYFPHSRLITGFVTRLTRRVPLVEQELLTLPEHLSSPPVFSGVRVTRSLVLYHYVCFVYRCLSFSTFFFWPLCCLFFDIRILIAPFVSSNSSYIIYSCTYIIHEYKFDLYSPYYRLSTGIWF
jgi:hypothetical protein